MMCADTVVYGGARHDKNLECDIGFVGGYWPHKGIVINNYLFPLLNEDVTLKLTSTLSPEQ